MGSERKRVAVVGSGVSGLVAAHTLRAHCDVTLYERDRRLGGHAHTHSVDIGLAEPVFVDSGFIVHNTTTYPVLTGIFDELGIRTRDTEMSMSIRDDERGIEFAGGKGVRGLVPSARHAVDVQHLRLLTEVPGFHRAARRHLHDDTDPDLSLAEFIERERLSDRLVQGFLLPLIAAVWSCPPQDVGAYPARYLFQFLANHGMLSVGRSLQWRTVVDGSARCAEAIAHGLSTVRTGTGVRGLRRTAEGVTITTDDGAVDHFDAAVIAVHPHQALRLLEDPTADERRLLGAIGYTPNPGLLHTDTSILPRNPRARGSWNYRTTGSADRVSITYDMTLLMGLPDTGTRVLVTLGGADQIDPRRVIAELDYEHPAFTTESVAAAQRLDEICTPTLSFAGAYRGWGFHEDGARSGLSAARTILSGQQ